jgi:hypothetical protein
MSQSAPQVFSGIAPEHYAALLKKAQANGFDLSGNSGTASKFGVEVAWNYDSAAQVLTFQCLRTPFVMKPEDVNAKIEALAKESLASGRLSIDPKPGRIRRGFKRSGFKAVNGLLWRRIS